VTTIGYLGSFAGPPAIGVLARDMPLSWALMVVAVAGVATAVLSRRALPGPPTRRG
jgi:hypothetical protein